MNDKIKASLVILFLLVVGGIADSYGATPEGWPGRWTKESKEEETDESYYKPTSAAEALSIIKFEEATYDDFSVEYPILLMVFGHGRYFYVIPTCWGMQQHSDTEAVEHFKQYRVHFGAFRSRSLASHYAAMLSELNYDDWSHLIH